MAPIFGPSGLSTVFSSDGSVGDGRAEELRRTAITTSYLFVCFSAVLFYRVAVLQKYCIDFAPFGLAALKALVMGKFIMLGRVTGMGDRYTEPIREPENSPGR